MGGGVDSDLPSQLEMEWSRSPQRSQPLAAYHPCGSQLRPDPLLHCRLKPISGHRGQGAAAGASPIHPSPLGAVRSVLPSSLTWSLPAPLNPHSASTGRFPLRSWGPGSGSVWLSVWNKGGQVSCTEFWAVSPGE